MKYLFFLLLFLSKYSFGQTYKYNDYVGFPVETYEKVGRYMQDRYDRGLINPSSVRYSPDPKLAKRIMVIQNLLSESNALFIELDKIDPSKSSQMKSKFNYYIDELNSSAGVSDNAIYTIYKYYFTRMRNKLRKTINEYNY